MREISAERAQFENASFGGTQLEGAHLKGSRFIQAHLCMWEDVFKASLTGADLTDADFSEAIVSKRQLEGAHYHSPPKAEYFRRTEIIGTTTPEGRKHFIDHLPVS